MTRDELKALCLLLGGREFMPGLPPTIYHFTDSNISRVVFRSKGEVMVGLCVHEVEDEYLYRTYKGAAELLVKHGGPNNDP